MIILRHSLFSLAGQDVMVLGFAAVSSVTVAVLAAVVGVVLALMLMGVAQVGCCGRACGCCGLAAAGGKVLRDTSTVDRNNVGV